MKNPMMPDYMFRTFDEITPAFLTSLGVKAILADIDNTLAPYEQPEPDGRIKGWIASLAEAGIGIAFVSNNDWERVNRFNATLGAPAYAKSGKPFKKNLVRAMNDLGGTLETTVMLGISSSPTPWRGIIWGSSASSCRPFGTRRMRSSDSSGGWRSLLLRSLKRGTGSSGDFLAVRLRHVAEMVD